MKSQDLKKYKLPGAPGVYFFKQKGKIIYIGKATVLKDRIKSYFSSDLISTRGPLLVNMVYEADKIDFIKTGSVLEALILESNLIKKYQPWYNTKEKDNKSFNYVVITREIWPRVLLVREREIDKGLTYEIASKFGPYTDAASLKKALKIIRKIFPFRDQCVPQTNKPCFNRQLGLCPGVCDGGISQKEYKKIVTKIKLLLAGQTNNLKKRLKNEMAVLSVNQEFEKAKEVRDQIFALEHIQDISLIGKGNEREINNFRIEAYDVAHLSGTNNVGVMVVMENREFNRSEYRKFKIRDTKGNDTGALKEILKRRLKHAEWPMPNLIVLDGGLAQFNVAKKITTVAVVAVTKDNRHKAKTIIGPESLVGKYKKEILLANNEAHRFAINFHRQKRSAII